jgi:hypothetical protein
VLTLRTKTYFLVPVFALAFAGCGSGDVAPDPDGGSGGAVTPADTIRPSTPTGLAATAVGDARIDLAWNASSDDVGVTGYRLERCPGAACANFAEISIASGSPYIDTSSLLPSTTYRYRVRATDGAGNLSLFSSIATATTQSASGTTLPLGALVHDGPATPEQISLFLPMTGALPQTATAVVRYKPTSSSTWTTGHPLYRIRPTFSTSPAIGSVPDAFAWPIIDVAPGTSYDVEVTVNSGATTNVKTLTHATRALPAPAGTPNKIISAGSSSATMQAALNNLNPGDVLEIANGTYNVNNLVLSKSGTLNAPIYIRGASRSGVVLNDPNGRIIEWQNANHVILENMTLQGSGVDGGTSSFHWGVFGPDFFSSTRGTIRNVTINGVNQGIVFDGDVSEFLVYDNTVNGNNLWTSAFIDTNLTWNDDGIRLAGLGNCAFNNTIKGFGDTFAYAGHSGDSTLNQAVAIHYYRNDIRNSGDDNVEIDHANRNNTFYDNRTHNAMTFSSLDPLYGGPFLFARNIGVNIGRTSHKWNDQNTGQFFYNNTLVMTVREGDDLSAWYQPNNGQQRSYGYRNNIFIYRGNGRFLPFIESGGHDPVDWTHNSWFPDRGIQWGSVFANLAAAQSGIPNTSPIFSGATKRFANDNITVSDPFVTPVVTGANYLTEVPAAYTPTLAGGTTPKNSGIEIPNITDGFSGVAPDRGAIIGGRSILLYGDRSAP